MTVTQTIATGDLDAQLKLLIRSNLLNELRKAAVESLMAAQRSYTSFHENASELHNLFMQEASYLSSLATLIEAERSALVSVEDVRKLMVTLRSTIKIENPALNRAHALVADLFA